MIWTVVLALIAFLAALILIARKTIKTMVVYEGIYSLLYRDGKFVGRLPAGRHHLFDPLGRTAAINFSSGRFSAGGSHIEIVTRDKFSLRAIIVAMCRLENPEEYLAAYPGELFSPSTSLVFHSKSLEPSAAELGQLLPSAILASSATLCLDDILSEPKKLTDSVLAQVRSSVPGLVVEELAITSLTVPPEVRKMFTEVERAKKESLAQVERARGEQAALRTLANAARLLEGNPHLNQLRLLQTMETAKGAKTFVLGQASEDPRQSVAVQPRK